MSLFKRAINAKNGAKFQRLWIGDIGEYDSPSEADLGLCDHLAFWTNNDAVAIDRLFRQSGLGRRDKWDSRHGEPTYGEMTIRKAMDRGMDGYTGSLQPNEYRRETDDVARLISTDPPVLDGRALHGLAGRLVRTIRPHTEAHDAALLSNVLTFAGSVIGSSPHLLVGRTRHTARIFVAQVGNTSKGRNGTAEDDIREPYSRAFPDWAGAKIQTGLSSGEGLISAVRDPIERQHPVREKGRVVAYETVTEDEGIADKRLPCYRARTWPDSESH